MFKFALLNGPLVHRMGSKDEFFFLYQFSCVSNQCHKISMFLGFNTNDIEIKLLLGMP